MSKSITIEVPDIGDFKHVEIIEVLVSPGDAIRTEDSLITLESDKTTLEIPSPRDGTVKQLHVSVGDKVSQGDAILTLDTEIQGADAVDTTAKLDTSSPRGISKPVAAPASVHYAVEVAVLGSGPGGYTAAFRAADLGKKVVLIERYDKIGGVCLNVGCIPSKALLHAAQVINEAAYFAEHGIQFNEPEIKLGKLVSWKAGVVDRLTGGLVQLAQRRNVQIVHGSGRFSSPEQFVVDTAEGVTAVEFEQAIIAAGSQSAKLAVFPWDDPRVMDSTDALSLVEIPERLLVVGGGIIGLEMATVFHALGSRITVVELTDDLIPGCDRDLVRPLAKVINNRFDNIYLGTKVVRVEAGNEALKVYFEGKSAPDSDSYDRILVATGRVPNGTRIGAEQAGVEVNEHGFIPVDSQLRTNVPHIFAIGDIVGPPMLAHKATHEGKVAAEVCAGMKAHFDARTIPSVAYTDPEVAWMGMTETEAKAQGIEYRKGVFPWAASGRSLALGRDEGMTKLLFDHDNRLIGAGVVGTNAGDLIAETVLALELAADAEDIGLSIHPHPTLSETVCFAAEAAQGTITDLYIPRSASQSEKS
jgi:dihydrolipoyl dehydrogenase